MGATLGILCLGWTVAIFAFGLTPLVFTSGSMSPAIHAGDLGFARTVEAGDVAVGDVVSVVNQKGTRITHRVVQVDAAEEGVTVTLKGDANGEPDVEPYTIDDTAERVAFSVPKAGYVVTAVSSPVGMFLGGLLAATALFVAFGRRGGGDDDDPPSPVRQEGASKEPDASMKDDHGVKRAGRVLTVATGGCALVAAATMSAVQPTQARWTDVAQVGTAAINSAPAPPAPTSISCTDSSGLGEALTPGAIISWPAVPSQAGHPVYIDFRVYADPLLVNQITNGDPTWIPPAPYRLPPGTTTWNRVRIPILETGDAWVRVRGVYLGGANQATWYSTTERVYRVNRNPLNIRTSCAGLVG